MVVGVIQVEVVGVIQVEVVEVHRRQGEEEGAVARAGAGQGGEERRTRGRHADGRAGQRGETHEDGKGRAGADRVGNSRVGNSRTSVRGRVVQCSKIKVYYNIIDTTTHPTVLESRGVMNVL